MNVQPTTEDFQMLLATEEHCRMKLEIIVLNRFVREQAAKIEHLSKSEGDGPSPPSKEEHAER